MSAKRQRRRSRSKENADEKVCLMSMAGSGNCPTPCPNCFASLICLANSIPNHFHSSCRICEGIQNRSLSKKNNFCCGLNRMFSPFRPCFAASLSIGKRFPCCSNLCIDTAADIFRCVAIQPLEQTRLDLIVREVIDIRSSQSHALRVFFLELVDALTRHFATDVANLALDNGAAQASEFVCNNKSKRKMFLVRLRETRQFLQGVVALCYFRKRIGFAHPPQNEPPHFPCVAHEHLHGQQSLFP